MNLERAKEVKRALSNVSKGYTGWVFNVDKLRPAISGRTDRCTGPSMLTTDASGF